VESANLKLSDGFDVPVGPDRVWSILSDPDTVVTCMPGAAVTGRNDDGSLDGTIVTKLGPTTVTFRGTVHPEFDAANRAGHLRARGSDARGRTKAVLTTSFRLSSTGAAHTRVDLDADIDVSGGLAAFVRTGGKHLVRRMLAEFSGNLAALAATQPAAQPSRPVHGLRLALQTLGDVLRDALRRWGGRGRQQRTGTRRTDE
jgi:uncharacterized protein